MSLNGYDISSYQGDINNTLVPGDFVLIKATEGIGYTDVDCDANFQQTLTTTKKVGTYHVGRPDGNIAAGEAQYYAQETAGYRGKGIFALDIEPVYIPAGFDIVSWVNQFVDTFHAITGIYPLVYLNASLCNSYDWSPVSAKCSLWLAAYGLDLPQNGYNVPSAPTVNGNWVIALFQYSSRTRLPNWSGDLDVNVFYGDAAAWDAYAGIHPATPQPVAQPAPAPAPVVVPTPVIVPAPTPAPTTTVEPPVTVTPAPVVAAPAGPGKLKSALNLITALAGLSVVKSYLKRLFDPTTGVGRTIRGVLQTAIGLVGFIMLIVSLPQFKDFWMSQPILTGWAAPTAVVGVVTAIWNGLGAIINYYQNLSNS